jgi:hypothetical protein
MINEYIISCRTFRHKIWKKFRQRKTNKQTKRNNISNYSIDVNYTFEMKQESSIYQISTQSGVIPHSIIIAFNLCEQKKIKSNSTSLKCLFQIFNLHFLNLYFVGAFFTKSFLLKNGEKLNRKLPNARMSVWKVIT